MVDGAGRGRRTVILGPGEGRTYPMGDVSAVVKADEGETDQRYSISEWWMEPRTKGPGPHSHPEDDVFYVLGGILHVFADDDWHEAPAGSIVVVPGGTVHDFQNRGDERAGFLNVSAPGGFEAQLGGIAEWFRDRSEAETRL